MRGYQYTRLDGSTSGEDRDKRMLEFNAPNSPKFIFLLSTRCVLCAVYVLCMCVCAVCCVCAVYVCCVCAVVVWFSGGVLLFLLSNQTTRTHRIYVWL